MLWLKKKKSHESAFLYCFYTCGELEVLKYEVHWEKKNQEENVFWKNKPGQEIRFLPFLTIFFKKIKIPSLSSEFLRFSCVCDAKDWLHFQAPPRLMIQEDCTSPNILLEDLFQSHFCFLLASLRIQYLFIGGDPLGHS